jgi:hypothetical protein
MRANVGGLATAVAGKATAAASAIASRADAAGSKLEERTGLPVSAAKEKVNQTAATLVAGASEQVAGVKQRIVDTAEDIEARVREKAIATVEIAIDKGIDRVAGDVKASLKDPDMPMSIQRAIDGMIDDTKPHVRDVIVSEVTTKLLRKAVEDPRLTAPPLPWCSNPYSILRAWVLYTMFPFDKSIWGQLRNPAYYFLMATACFPVMGVSECFWTLMFFLKDKRDEYQLVDYIIAFKVAQFVGGCLAVLAGAVLYALCANKEDHSCDANGPGTHLGFSFEVYFALLKTALCWWAAAMIPCSEKKGGRLYKALHSERAQGIEVSVTKADMSRKGGRVFYWLGYDFVIFAVTVALGVVSLRADDDEWTEWAKIYWLKALYGIMALPWVILKLPMMYTLVLHVRPTAYNRRGQTVPVLRKKERLERRGDGQVAVSEGAGGGAGGGGNRQAWGASGAAKVVPASAVVASPA